MLISSVYIYIWQYLFCICSTEYEGNEYRGKVSYTGARFLILGQGNMKQRDVELMSKNG